MIFSEIQTTEAYLNPNGHFVIKQAGGYAHDDQVVVIPCYMAKALIIRMRELIKAGELVDYKEAEDA